MLDRPQKSFCLEKILIDERLNIQFILCDLTIFTLNANTNIVCHIEFENLCRTSVSNFVL